LASAIAALSATCAVAVAGVAGAAKPSAASWKPGDCFAQATVDADEVTLTSKVPCTKAHEVQILHGVALPADLARAGLDTLTSPTSDEHAQLVDLARETCTPSRDVGAVYPKVAKKLQRLIAEHDIPGWAPPAPGNTGWVLPEPASFEAGTKDLLCIFHVAQDPVNKTPGDVRKLATKAALGGFRICFDFDADDVMQAASCADVHDVESLLWVELPVAGHPDSVNDWTDADYETFDSTCRALGQALVGSTQRQLRIRADTGATPPSPRGTRLFDCTAYPADEHLRLPPGSIVGTGTAKIPFVESSS
jgi:hypothetical protein